MSYDAEIQERFEVSVPASEMLRTNVLERPLRLAATTAAGFIPLVGPAVGAAANALDPYVLDEVFPESGPVAFLTDLYLSIFRS